MMTAPDDYIDFLDPRIRPMPEGLAFPVDRSEDGKVIICVGPVKMGFLDTNSDKYDVAVGALQQSVWIELERHRIREFGP